MDNTLIASKVTIAGHSYTLRVSEAEAIVVNRAAELINERLETFRKQYGIEDNAYLLSMVLLQIAAELEKAKDKELSADADVVSRLEKIESLLQQ